MVAPKCKRQQFALRNPKKFVMAKELGATDCVNPKDYDKPIQQASQKVTVDGFGSIASLPGARGHDKMGC